MACGPETRTASTRARAASALAWSFAALASDFARSLAAALPTFLRADAGIPELRQKVEEQHARLKEFGYTLSQLNGAGDENARVDGLDAVQAESDVLPDFVKKEYSNKVDAACSKLDSEVIERYIPDFRTACDDHGNVDHKFLTERCICNPINVVVPKVVAKYKKFISAAFGTVATLEAGRLENVELMRSYLGVCHASSIIFVQLAEAGDGDALKRDTLKKLQAQKIKKPEGIPQLLS